MGDYMLRPIEEIDLPLLLQWRNSEKVHSKMLTNHRITWEEHSKWFQRMKDDPIKRNLVFQYKGRPIGYNGYTEYDPINKTCSPGAYLGESNVPIDAGFTLFFMSIEYAFSVLDMQRLETSVFKSNKKARRLDEYLGYKMVPSSERVCLKDGKEEILIRMFMTRDGWAINKKKFNLGGYEYL